MTRRKAQPKPKAPINLLGEMERINDLQIKNERLYELYEKTLQEKNTYVQKYSDLRTTNGKLHDRIAELQVTVFPRPVPPVCEIELAPFGKTPSMNDFQKFMLAVFVVMSVGSFVMLVSLCRAFNPILEALNVWTSM